MAFSNRPTTKAHHKSDITWDESKAPPDGILDKVEVSASDGMLAPFAATMTMDEVEKTSGMSAPIAAAMPNDVIVHSGGQAAPIAADLITTEPEPKNASCEPPVETTRVIQLFTPASDLPTFTRVHHHCKISDIVAAEFQLGSLTTPVHIKDAVGGPIPITKEVGSFEQIHVHVAGSYQPATISSLCHPTRGRTNRISLLYSQEGWVAQDEMDFYLVFLNQIDQVGFIHSIVGPVLDPDAATWFESLLKVAQQEGCAASSILQDTHWHPIVVWCRGETTWVSTTGFGKTFISEALGDQVRTYHFNMLELPSVFHADCGFQTIGAILQEVLDHAPQDNETHPLKSFPVSTETAVAWRYLFETHLHSSGKARCIVVPSKVRLGGAMMDPPEKVVADLLSEHGVPQTELQQRTKTVFEKLGRSQILNAMRSPRPWAELKSLCNNQTPKIQLVMPSELAQSIQNRTDQQTPFGDKSKKKTKGVGPPLPITLAPHDISIPDGIFKQGQDQLLKQIPVQAIGPEASGVVVVAPQDATPHLSRSSPISSQGLALLLLDHSHSSCTGLGSLIRFPCKCELTGEPVLVSARLIQIGSIEVTKHVPSSASTVDEVSTSVARVALYKDECGEDWSQIIQHPIRHILTMLGIESKGQQNTVVDVWDRQCLTIKLTRTSAAKCDLFFASLRLVGENTEELQSRSGAGGIYVEPRSIDGRSPCSLYRVIWLKLDKASTTAAMQSSHLPVHLARHGTRFGLRAKVDIAEEVHRLHKASVPYLDTPNVIKYVAGPFPFGATRESLIKVFSKWGWSARPTQPKGRTPDGVGIQWEVHASTHPPCEVYSMTHGDVIISAIEHKKSTPKVGSDLLASAKTIAVLRQPKALAPSVGDKCDSLQMNDPWAGYVPSKAARGPYAPASEATIARVNQIESLTTSIDKKLADHIAQVDQRLANTDVSMNASTSSEQQTQMNDFEHRILQLEQNMQQQHSQQMQHQSQVAQQFQQMQTRMDLQAQSFHSHLDQRMTEQLNQIEMLLLKKARTE